MRASSSGVEGQREQQELRPISERILTALRQTEAHGGPRRLRTDATKLISDLSARDNPRVRLARDQCIPAWALLTGGLGKAKI